MSNCHGCGERLVLILSQSKKGGRGVASFPCCCVSDQDAQPLSSVG